MPEALVYVIRPDNTALWLPPELLAIIDAWQGDKLTEEQFNHKAIQQLLADRSIKRRN